MVSNIIKKRMVNQLKKLLPNHLNQRIRLLLHRGNRYTCPFCNYASKDLSLNGIDTPILKEKQVVGGGRRNSVCLKCGSTDRDRLIYIYLSEKFKLFSSGKHKKILHIAPEPCLSEKILEFGFDNYICGDLFTEGYIYPKYVMNFSILDIPFPDDNFDLIICNHVLEHIPNDLAAMNELFRVLKPDGTAILQVPISANSINTVEDFSIIDSKQRELMFGQFDHVRIYGQDYTDRLEKSGFKVERINIWKEFEKYGLNKEEDIFLCEKKLFKSA